MSVCGVCISLCARQIMMMNAAQCIIQDCVSGMGVKTGTAGMIETERGGGLGKVQPRLSNDMCDLDQGPSLSALTQTLLSQGSNNCQRNICIPYLQSLRSFPFMFPSYVIEFWSERSACVQRSNLGGHYFR